MDRDRYPRARSPDRRYYRDSDSYIPSSRSAPRPRSRTPPPRSYRARSPPPLRESNDYYRGAPPRRYESSRDSYPARESRARSPPRREYSPHGRYEDRGRATRDRSPRPLKRGPDIASRGNTRSPPPMKRERLASPRREYTRTRSPPRENYRPRSRSPRRDGRSDPYSSRSWRRQSSVPRSGARSGGGSGRNSVASSRRSSPRPHARPSDSYHADSHRDDHYRGHSPSAGYRSPRRRSPPPREAPPPATTRARSPHTSEDAYGTRHSHKTPVDDRASNGRPYPPPPTAPADHRERPPPTGPAASMTSSYRNPGNAPPIGPAASSMSSSSHSRPSSTYSSSAPAYPSRGGVGPGHRGGGRGGSAYPSRDFSGAAPPVAPRGSGSWGGPPPPSAPHGRGGGRGGSNSSGGSYPLRDPHAPSHDGGAPHHGPRRESFNFHHGRGGNSSSLTTPRTQRFNTAMSDLPKIKEGGEKQPPLYDTTKANKLEEEAARLRKLIDDKEERKRDGLREWEKLERESSNSALRTELAEEHLKSMNGEDGLATAAF